MRKKTRKIEEMGAIMNRFYVDQNTVIDLMEKDGDPKFIFGDMKSDE